MKKIIFYINIFLFPLSLYADKIILKTGETLEGRVEYQTVDTVFFKRKDGEKIQIKKDSIRGMTYDKISKPTDSPFKDDSNLPRNNPSDLKEDLKLTGITKEKTIEKVTIDKELTNSIMKKFEDADKRRETQIQEELKFLQDELQFLKKERERLSKERLDMEEFKKTMDKRMAVLEIRIRRLERYLAMDETMIEYYQSPRSPWDIVKRSAIFPGWGHRYAREEYTGNAYSTSFLGLLALGFFINFQANSAEETVKDKFNADITIRSLQFSSLGGGGILATTSLLTTFSSYERSMNAVNSQKQLSSILINGAILLYGIQLVHAYFTGVEWAKSSPRDYSNESLLKAPVSWNFHTVPDYSPQSLRSGVIYNLEFFQRF